MFLENICKMLYVLCIVILEILDDIELNGMGYDMFSKILL